MEKCDLDKLLKQKSERISLKSNASSTKSDVWPIYQLVYVDEEFSGFVICQPCSTLLKWKFRDGTSGLKSHAKSCGAQTSNTKGDQLLTAIPGFSSLQKTVSSADKYSLADTVVEMCAKDIRPFNVVEGIGFKALAQKLVGLGARYGNFPVDDVLPCSRTVSHHLSNVAESAKLELKTELADIWRLAVTADMWTHEATNNPYITVTVHYINDCWALCAKILATKVMEEKKTAQNIKLVVNQILEEFSANRLNNYYVTDNGANIKAAFTDQNWVSCSGHNLNLIVSHALDSKNIGDGSPFKPVIELFSVCKDIVTRVKRTQLQSKLDTTLKQEVPTRWNSTLTMLISITENFAMLQTLAGEMQDKTLQKLLLDVNEDLLADVINILKPFDAATRLISADRAPTLHLAAVRLKLKKHLSHSDSDTTPMKHLRMKLRHYLDTYLRLNQLHLSAVMLHPCLKSNTNIMTDAEKDEAMDCIRKMMSEFPQANSACTFTTDSVDENILPTKRPRRSSDSEAESFFDDLFLSTPTVTADELASYIQSTDTSDSEDILSFWKQKANKWPKLAAVARTLLAIPATETSSERVFSIAGRTIEDRRTQLTEESVNDLLFLHGLNKQK